MQLIKSLRQLLVFAMVVGSSAVHAMKVPAGNNFDLNINILAQARASAAWDGDAQSSGASPAGTVATDFYIRRARLITSGLAFNKFTFYMMLDTPNFGVRGFYGTPPTGTTIL